MSQSHHEVGRHRCVRGRGKDLLTRVVAAFEAFSPRIYLDAGGKQTIGFGHLIKPGEDFSSGLPRESALTLLQDDMADAKQAAFALFEDVYMLTKYERDALTSFVFNLGAGEAVRESRLRDCVRLGRRTEAAGEFLKWVHVTMPDGTKKKLAGLIRRRDCESVWYLGAHPSTIERMSGALPEND